VGVIIKRQIDGDYDWISLWVPKDDGKHHFGETHIFHYDEGLLIETGTTNLRIIEKPNPEILTLDDMIFGWLNWRLFYEENYNRGEM